MSRSETILPWTVARNVRLALERPLHAENGSELGSVTFEPTPEFGPAVMDMADADSWSRIRIPVTVETEEATLSQALMDDEVISKEVRCVLVVVCATTKTRRAVDLSPGGDARWVGEFEVSRSEVAGTLSLHTRLVRANRASQKALGRATDRGALIGESAETLVVVDRWARPYNGPIRWLWRRFSEDENPFIRSRYTDLYFVDTSGAPTVFLNLDYEHLPVILESKDRGGPAALLRTSIASGIASAVWYQMLTSAVLQLQRDEETGEVSLSGDWRGSIIRSVLPVVYPGTDRAAALEQLLSQRDDSDLVAGLMSRLAAAAQQLGRLGKEFSAAATMAKRIKGAV